MFFIIGYARAKITNGLAEALTRAKWCALPFPDYRAAQRIALEGYPGLLARAVSRMSYKSDERVKQTEERRAVRELIVDALTGGRHPFRITLHVDSALRQRLINDGTGDRLDAVLCAVAAAWAMRRPYYGLPPVLDPVEGWIVGAVHGAQ